LAKKKSSTPMGYTVKIVLNKGGRINRNGLYTIYLQVIMNRKAYYFNLDKKIEKIHWQGKDNVWVKPSFRYAPLLNIYIKRKLDDVLLYVHRFEASGRFITIDDFRSVFNKRSVTSFNDYLDEYMQKQTRGLKVNTIKKYKTFERYIDEYAGEISFQSLNGNFVIQFCHWLHEKKQLHGSTIHKYLDPFRKVLRCAITEAYLDHDPFLHLKIPYSEQRKTEKQYLSITELKRIKDKVIPKERAVLEKVREWFLFSFYCGIRYKDLSRLVWDDFIETDQGLCLNARRIKNGNDYHVPIYMSAHALEIYRLRFAARDEERVFPERISEQRYNDHLKELAELVGIKKNLKNSSARDAFGKYWAGKGIPIQHLAKMMGHVNEKTTKSYYAIDGEDINEHMDLLKDKGILTIDF
jgi:site-specific recombinase XerD